MHPKGACIVRMHRRCILMARFLFLFRSALSASLRGSLKTSLRSVALNARACVRCACMCALRVHVCAILTRSRARAGVSVRLFLRGVTSLRFGRYASGALRVHGFFAAHSPLRSAAHFNPSGLAFASLRPASKIKILFVAKTCQNVVKAVCEGSRSHLKFNVIAGLTHRL